MLSSEEDSVSLAYRIASLVNLNVVEEQRLLECASTLDLLRSLYAALSKEIQILQLREKITRDAQTKIGKSQREYILPDVLNDPAAFQKFTQAQGELSSALSRLLVVTENYPQLKSDALFKDLMAQLEGTENRITVARNRYIKSVQEYNVGIRTFPNNLTAMMFGYKEKPNFSVENEKEISVAPKVDFSPAPAPAK